jgi:hypothetical protein
MTVPMSRLSEAAGAMPPRARLVEADHALSAQLVATIIAIVDDEPVVRLIDDSAAPRLPTAVFRPDRQASLDACLRTAVQRDTGLELGHVEQLQATVTEGPAGEPMFCIGYLALAHGSELSVQDRASWHGWYAHFPWEDWRRGRPRILREDILPVLEAWAREEVYAELDPSEVPRRHRIHMSFGDNEQMWDEEKVVERFDLLSEAGVVGRVGRNAAMRADHLRCLAVAMSRLRSRIKSRPLVFDLMPARFTLYELQRTVEAILGPHLHKQNFRRLVEHMGLVEPTDEMKSHTGGRPAKLFRFRQECLLERLQPGVRVRGARG